MKRKGSPKEIIASVAKDFPEVAEVLDRAREEVPFCKREISEYQAAALYALARPFNAKGAHILEIGTALGYSACVLAQAAPRARIVTLNPKEGEREAAKRYLEAFQNVAVRIEYSWDYLAAYKGPELDMVFVDGDHKRVERDFPWFNRLKASGLMLFHDYSPNGSWRPTPTVYDALNRMAAGLGRAFDVLVQDDRGVGMAGFYRKEGEKWPMPR